VRHQPCSKPWWHHLQHFLQTGVHLLLLLPMLLLVGGAGVSSLI
jgi:hypothetical protein